MTKPNVRVIERSEKKLEGIIEELMETALDTVEIINITPRDEMN